MNLGLSTGTVEKTMTAATARRTITLATNWATSTGSTTSGFIVSGRRTGVRFYSLKGLGKVNRMGEEGIRVLPQ